MHAAMEPNMIISEYDENNGFKPYSATLQWLRCCSSRGAESSALSNVNKKLLEAYVTRWRP